MLPNPLDHVIPASVDTYIASPTTVCTVPSPDIAMSTKLSVIGPDCTVTDAQSTPAFVDRQARLLNATAVCMVPFADTAICSQS